MRSTMRGMVLSNAEGTSDPSPHTSEIPWRRTRTYLRGDYFVASGFQFVSNVIGAVALLSSTV